MTRLPAPVWVRLPMSARSHRIRSWRYAAGLWFGDTRCSLRVHTGDADTPQFGNLSDRPVYAACKTCVRWGQR